MSRGPSPSPVSVQAPIIPHSASSVSLRSPNLRINLDASHRSRSNTTLSPPPQHYHEQYIHPRSLSQQLSPTEAKDVVMAVRNLRGDLNMENTSRSGSPARLREMVLDEQEDEEYDDSMDMSMSTSVVDYETPRKPRRGRRSDTTTPARAGVSTMQRIMRALEKSPDEGDTLDLSRKGIDSIGDEDVVMFKQGVGKDMKGVWRLALSYNALDDGAIVKSFSNLTRLRYLNLKGNLLTQFPEALTNMSNLEILDLSKNNITSFPEIPNNLVKLKVLSLTHNGIYTLPTYMTDFNSLKVFKVAHNPIEWPPREVLGALVESEMLPEKDPVTGKTKRDEDLRPWIENMKSWMRQKAVETDRLLERSRSEDEAYLASEEEPSSAISLDYGQRTPWANSTPTSTAPSSQQTVRRITRDDQPRSDSPSRQLPFFGRHDSSNTASASEESLDQISTFRRALPNRSGSSSHLRQTSTSSFTPPTSATTVSSSGHSREPSMNLPQPLPNASTHGHSRGGSYEPNQRLSGQLMGKKSLPDLRQSHAKIISERRGDSTPAEQTRLLGLGSTPASPSGLKSPVKPAWNGQMLRSVTGGPSSPRTLNGGLRRRSNEFMRRLGGDIQEKRHSQDDPHVDESKNSYFRRLSTLPTSSISKSVPPALLAVIDAIRGMLFAMSQLHMALRQYLTFALNERVAGVLNRVMEPAGSYMATLINALDRFDSMSRRNNVPPQAIRSVLEATKESVAVFGKVVSVLKLQSPALRSCDIRYTRTLLLMIFGSMSEIARSWQEMGPLLKDIKPLISLDGGIVARALGGQKMIPTGSFSGRTPISPIPERGESHSPPSVQRGSLSTVTGGSPIAEETTALDSLRAEDGDPRLARNRRQGGSFSSHDVEKGMMMGSPGLSKPGDNAPLGYLRHRPSESAHSALGQMVESDHDLDNDLDESSTVTIPPFPIKTISPNGTSANIPLTPTDADVVDPASTLPPPWPQPHINRNGHKPMSSSGSSHALSIATGPQTSFRKLSVDVRPPTPTSATLFDEDLLDVIESATENAFTTWLRLAEDVGGSSPDSSGNSRTHSKTPSQSSLNSNADFSRPFMSNRPDDISPQHHAELLAALSNAEQTTSNLRESLMGLRANPATFARTTLPDDTQSFIQIVVRVSALVKLISINHTFSQPVRSSISRLTQSTRECAILMQVSSLRPTGGLTPSPYSASANSTRGNSPHHRSQLSLTSSGPGASSEDLTTPHSASLSTPGSAGWGSASGSGSGLRGLQLPRRQLALNRDRNGTLGGRN